MLMKTFEKHKKYFEKTYHLLETTKNPNEIRRIIRELMQYLEDYHLVDKNYLDHNPLFVQCESNQDLIKQQNTEMMLSFLTMIYRIDFIAADSDAYMIYYNNKMLMRILKHLILGLNV